MLYRLNNRITMVFTEDGFTSSNAVLVEDSDRLMIDSGCGSILESIRPGEVDVLLNSHHHIDHISGNRSFTRAVVMAHPLEKVAMTSPEKTAAADGWRELMGDDVLDHISELDIIIPSFLEPWPVDRTFADGTVINCGTTEIIVLETPGHTAGHCSFLFPRENFIFTADICLTRVGPWYGDPDTSVDDFIRSVDRIIALKPSGLATGHLMEILTDNITSTLITYRDRIFRREERILNFLKTQPASIDGIAEKKFIYPLHPTTFVLFWEKCMVKKHLDRLVAVGLVERDPDGIYRTRP